MWALLWDACDACDATKLEYHRNSDEARESGNPDGAPVSGRLSCYSLGNLSMERAFSYTGADRVWIQLCEWHVAESIKKHVKSKTYDEQSRKAIHNETWDYIKSATTEDLTVNRNQLISSLHIKEREYLDDHVVPIEHQFVRAITQTYPNLGVNSTQRNEGHHPEVKALLNKQKPLPEACALLGVSIKKKCRALAVSEAKSLSNLPRVIDRQAFKHLIVQVPRYVLDILIPEWRATQRWAELLGGAPKTEAEEEAGDDEVPDPPVIPGCVLGCGLPIRMGLPCRCWMWVCLEGDRPKTPIPISLIHPRWLLDGPGAHYTPWTISY